jgi:YbbR domain-containing protein
MKTRARNWLLENASYKIVALVVALVLWMTMQGRRDSVLTREMEMQVLLSPHHAITNPIPQVVRVEVSGPRVALRRLAERRDPFTVDLSHVPPGRQLVRLTKDSLNLPLGAKVLNISPEEFLAVIVEEVGNDKGKGDVEK